MLTVLVRLFCESSREGGGVVRLADPGKSLGPVATSAPGSSLGPVASADPGKSLGPSRRCRSGLDRQVGRSAGWGLFAARSGARSKRASSACRLHISYVQGGALPSRRKGSPAVPPSTGSTGAGSTSRPGSITRGIAPCHFAGVGRPLCGQQCATGCGQHPPAGGRRGRRLLC